MTSSKPALADLGLDESEESSDEYRNIVSGAIYPTPHLPFPYAQAYAGWQFGQFAGQLGDGRVHTLFEVKAKKKYEVQLKGSGKTPFSRFADGKAVIRSSIREYIISEHLNALKIPTTRALALTYLPKTYAQRHAAEKCAIVARFAESWVRCGTFDLYRWRVDNAGARRLADYVINLLDGFTYAKDALKRLPIKENLTSYDMMYFDIVARNASTTAMWQAYGFLNGVLNTDNTSVLGLSMDFGPFSILDKFDPKYSPNSEDHQGRYSYENTPTAVWWTLTRLGEDLAALIGAGDLLNDPAFKLGLYKDGWEEKIIERATKIIAHAGEIYQYAFTKTYVETFLGRLGLKQSLIDYDNVNKLNEELIAPLLSVLKALQCDYNMFFLRLQEGFADKEKFAQSVMIEPGEHDFYDKESIKKDLFAWLDKYSLFKINPKISKEYNPLFLPRNWILDEVIQQAQESECEDVLYLKKLEKMLFYPFDRSKWGSELKDVEERWMIQGNAADELTMLRCSCLS